MSTKELTIAEIKIGARFGFADAVSYFGEKAFVFTKTSITTIKQDGFPPVLAHDLKAKIFLEELP